MTRLSVAALGLAAWLGPQMPSEAPAPMAPDQVLVDQDCRVAMPTGEGLAPVFRADFRTCHLEGRKRTTVRQTDPAKGEADFVTVSEQTFVLHNPSAGALTFLVERIVPQGWAVDSDPQPAEVHDHLAIFRVRAEAGETVRLHVGIRSLPDQADSAADYD